MSVEAHARSIRERGYTLFERVYDEAWVDALRAEIEAIYDELGRPVPYSKDSVRIAPDADLCVAGLAVHHLLQRRPELADKLFRAEVVESIRSALGPDTFLEVSGFVLSDESRPFMGWHTHVGSVNDDAYRHTGDWPKVDAALRVMALTYLDDLSPETGRLRLYPRRAGEPTGPPLDPEEHDWEGQIEIACPKGSVLVLEQCTWHSVIEKTSPGLRIFLCSTFASPRAGRAVWQDDSLRDLTGGGELLQSLIRREP